LCTNPGGIRRLYVRELAEDPYRIELEDDPTKEQEEYFKRIRQEWMDPGSSEEKMEHKEDNYFRKAISEKQDP
jgi:hypothetical protein